MKKYWQIGTALKCKRKKKGNGLPDKHKAQDAARGEQLAAKTIRKGLPMPQIFSQTVKPLTFAFMMKIAVTLECMWCTRQTAHFRIHDEDCSNTRLYVVHSG
jgi:hypothetical protein